MSLVAKIREVSAKALSDYFKIEFTPDDIQINQTKPEFTGDYTLVLFSLIKQLRKAPEALGQEIGTLLLQQHPNLFSGFNVIKGFLNLSVAETYLTDWLEHQAPDSFRLPSTGKKVIVEYSSPNTNKPLHLGHLRNNFLGWSIASILKATGNEVLKTCIVNDRGIHICKSMIAWKRLGNGATPSSTGMKGDHFVGDYYVKCEELIREEAKQVSQNAEDGNFSGFSDKDKQRVIELQEMIRAIIPENDKNKEKIAKLTDDRKELIRANTPVMKSAQEMLLKWEEGDAEVIQLWKLMNGWVYEGFDQTYARIGSDFDKIYYESETYLLGKKVVEEGLASGLLFRKNDGSVWIDLTKEGLDEKLVLRKDGTSVYITQDLGLADEKYKDFPYDQSIYVIADEQNYHMKVLQLILKKAGKPYADGIFHLSYGMVELPHGRMKSREGTVVDADDLVDEMISIAASHTEALGKVKDFSDSELRELYSTLALGALKFYLLRVDPKKKMVFNPEESIDFHGFTGPFVQYAYARIQSILRKTTPADFEVQNDEGILPLERELLRLLEQYQTVLLQAASEYNPSAVANYAFLVAKTYNSFYTEHSVLNAETSGKKALRLKLSKLTGEVIRNSLAVLGIQVPERM